MPGQIFHNVEITLVDDHAGTAQTTLGRPPKANGSRYIHSCGYKMLHHAGKSDNRADGEGQKLLPVQLEGAPFIA